MRPLRVHRPGMLAAVAASGVLPGAFLEAFGDHPASVDPVAHLVLVALGAGTAGLAALGLALAGVRAGDGRTVLIATAFTTMTALLAVHGLATPGVIVGLNGVVAFAGGLSLPAGAALLALAALPGVQRLRRPERLLWLQGALFVVVSLLGLAALAEPSLVPSVPEAGTAPALALAVVGGVLYGVLALRALWTAALSRRAPDLIVALGCCWLGAALIPQLILGFGTVGFYGGHVLELTGIGMIAIPVVMDLARGRTAQPLLGTLSAADLVAEEEAYLGARVRALLVSLAAKDESTARHTRRVALRAVQVGEALRLPAPALRDLATGAMLHDVGKLSVPDAVLKKPAGLTDEEFAEIKRHPGAGLHLLQALGGFGDAVLALVHEHHERLDGSGYPQGLEAADLALPTRILAVCDVYDALTSDRVYRDAWSERSAFELLHREAGVTLDARCVQALQRVVAGDVVADAPALQLGGAPALPAAAPAEPAR